MVDYDDEYLAHVGIVGMKWGRRKRPDGSYESSGKGPKESKRSKAKAEIASMSDDQLRQRINRLQMEKQYSQLTTGQTNAGKKIAKEIVGNAAKDLASSYVKKALKSGVEQAVKAATKR